MEKITGNEPAMPIKDAPFNAETEQLSRIKDNAHFDVFYQGLTIRQQFTMSAMHGFASNPDWAKSIDDWDNYLQRLVTGAIELADLQIKALNETPNPNDKETV